MRSAKVMALLAALAAGGLKAEEGLDDVSKARQRAETDQVYRRGRMSYAQGLARTRHTLGLPDVPDPRAKLLLATAGPAARMAAGPSAEDITLLGMLAIQEMSSFATAMLDLWPSGSKRIACEPGCAFCCRQRIACSIPEAAAIADYLRSEDAEAKRVALSEDLPPRSVGIDAWIGSLQVVADVTEGMTTSDDWARAGVRCGFLMNYRCGIYGSRPLACIGHTSVSKADCRRSVGDPTAKIPTPVTPKLEVGLYQVGMVDALRRSGLQPMAVDMHRAVLLCLKDPSAVNRWLLGEPMFDSMALPVAGMNSDEDLDILHEESADDIKQARIRIVGSPIPGV